MPLSKAGLVIPHKRKIVDENDSHPNKQPQMRVDLSKEIKWNVQWRAPQTKKHKTWDGDAVVGISPGSSGSFCTLYDDKGNVLSRQVIPLENVKEGDLFRLGEREFQIDYPLSSGSAIQIDTDAAVAPKLQPKPSAKFVSRPFIPVRSSLPEIVEPSFRESAEPLNKAREGCWEVSWRKSSLSKNAPWQEDGFLEVKGATFRLISEQKKLLSTGSWKGSWPYIDQEVHLSNRQIRINALHKGVELFCNTEMVSDDPVTSTDPLPGSPTQTPLIQNFVPPISKYAPPRKPINIKPRHDPEAEGAVVMKLPNEFHQAKHNKNGISLVPVVIDPIICKHLRPHQKEGVKFMYECVMGMRRHEGYGCILADEMGLGKTLQTITLIWTLLKQSPYAGAPVIGKCLIACPVSLINNWKNEFVKWIGKDRIGVFVGDKDKATIKQFTNSKIHHVLIIGYERLKGVINELAYCNPPIGLIVCDEGHRLKSSQSQVNQMFGALKTPRRIILSGTPIQNNLEELHAMSDFCNPGLLDDYPTFKKLYENPIVKSRTPACSKKELKLGNLRSTQLLNLCESFVLRRDASILSNYLPPKFEYIVFIKPTQLQISILNVLLNQNSLSSLISGSTAKSLALITKLMKVSNSPLLLESKDDDEDEREHENDGDLFREATKLLPRNAYPADMSLSGKLNTLSNILKFLQQKTEEKCVIVSHFISTLDIIQSYCEKKNYTFGRLDGRTQSTKRQEIVDRFNKSSQRDCFLFLVSTKAGGIGLNLIGASRLVLFDSGWNPSHDLQAMARIHRDGQNRVVYVYRLLTAGTIDEKVYQRQVTKIGLSDALMANNPESKSRSKLDSFSPQEVSGMITRLDDINFEVPTQLRDLFTFHANTPCHTHDLLGCTCSHVSNMNFEDTDLNAPSEDESDSERGWVVASQLDTEKMSRRYAKQKKAELSRLTSDWLHVNCLVPAAHERIQDILLKHVVSENNPERKTPLTGQALSRAEQLLATVDAWHDQMTEEEAGYLDTSGLEGGRITYVFERKSE